MDVYLFFELTEVAVDTPGGLMVPNIKAWSKSHLNLLRDNGWLKTTEFFDQNKSFFSVDFWRFILKRLGDLETKDVGGKNVLEIQQELMRVAAAAQQGKLQLADIQAHPNNKKRNTNTKRTWNEKHGNV